MFRGIFNIFSCSSFFHSCCSQFVLCFLVLCLFVCFFGTFLFPSLLTPQPSHHLKQRLLEHVEDSEGVYRNELIKKILFICSEERYAYVTNFAWYIGVLVNLARTTDHSFGSEISAQLIDVSTRVEGVRAFSVQLMVPLLMDGKLQVRYEIFYCLLLFVVVVVV